jgi:putative ABC transport system ATP-binding protein
MAPLIEVEGLVRSFGALRALDGISFAVEEGEWLAVTGPSGSGKTTLLNILSGLDSATSGRVRVGSTELSALPARRLAGYRRETVGLVFQQFHLIPYLTARENVQLAQYLHSMSDRAEAAAALAHVGLGARLDHLPRELSGGEQQRVCIARALINQPRLVAADEPTGNLDAVNEEVVMSLLEDLHRRGHTIVLVTHDPAIAARADRELRLEHGRLAPAAANGAASHEGVAFLAELWRALVEDSATVPVARRGVAGALADGLLAYVDGRLSFTERGRSLAAQAVRRQRLSEALRARVLEDVAEDACGRVTPLLPSLVEEVAVFLEHPDRCPHGRPIPPAMAPTEVLTPAGGSIS